LSNHTDSFRYVRKVWPLFSSTGAGSFIEPLPPQLLPDFEPGPHSAHLDLDSIKTWKKSFIFDRDTRTIQRVLSDVPPSNSAGFLVHRQPIRTGGTVHPADRSLAALHRPPSRPDK
ncbi:MAG: hypothetical protein PHU85_19565, partial [Phycisphaerae bacterium]|nr:hypothetical protein [Phycisphaerae bacterium]